MFKNRLLAAVAFVASAAIYVPAHAEPVKLQFSAVSGPTSFLVTDVIRPWLDDIQAASNGTVEVEVVAGSALARPADVFDAVKSGLVDMGWSATAYNPGRFPESGVVELPFETTDAAAASPAVWELYDRGLFKGFDGVKVLSIMMSATQIIHGNAEDITSIEALKGKPVRAAGGTISEVIKTFGATPVGVPITEVAESLGRNVISATAADWYSLEAFGLMDVTRTHIEVPLGCVTVYYIMNQAVWDGLPDEAKAAFDKYSGAVASKRWGDALSGANKRVRGLVEAKEDHKIVEVGKEEVDHWRSELASVVEDWKKSVPNGEAVLNAYREEVSKLGLSVE